MGNLWKLPEGVADSLSDPFPGFVVSREVGVESRLWRMERVGGVGTELVHLDGEPGPVGMWELLRQAGDSLGPRHAPSRGACLSGPCLLSAFPEDAWLSVFLPPLPTSPKGKTVKLVSACCTDFRRSLPDFWSVCQSACDLPLTAAASLAPRLPCMMPE